MAGLDGCEMDLVLKGGCRFLHGTWYDMNEGFLLCVGLTCVEET